MSHLSIYDVWSPDLINEIEKEALKFTNEPYTELFFAIALNKIYNALKKENKI
jgi:hypothetical protein